LVILGRARRLLWHLEHRHPSGFYLDGAFRQRFGQRCVHRDAVTNGEFALVAVELRRLRNFGQRDKLKG